LADAATAAEPDWLVERRRQGASLASELELPTQKAKGWEFTDLSGLDFEGFSSGGLMVEVTDEAAGTDEALIHPLEGAVLDPERAEVVREHLGSVVSIEDPFVARNDAGWELGALIHVPAGRRAEKPLAIHVSPAAGNGGSPAANWRTLIVVEEGAEAELWESFADGPGTGLFNFVTEIVLGPGARLRYITVQDLDESSWVFGTQRAEVDRDAELDWVALGFGSGRGKVRMETKLAGQGSSARVTGGYAGHGRQHLDFDTTQEHAARHTTSDLAFRGVLGDRATAVWRGMIRVDPGAQQTDAFQESRNLLLSTGAHADAIPGLEIEANDVRCTHAAAVAQVDRDQLFYLRTRGLDAAAAKRLIIEGFMEALVERLAEGPVRESLSAALERRLESVLGDPE
jgi:Fe-S cluster assembly protein SufD